MTFNNPRIRSIRIRLDNYKFYHAPYEMDYADPKFMGREKQLDTFVEILRQSDSKKGKYLISGVRGVGKTSFVNRAIEKLGNQPKVQNDAKTLILKAFTKVVSKFKFGKKKTVLNQKETKDEKEETNNKCEARKNCNNTLFKKIAISFNEDLQTERDVLTWIIKEIDKFVTEEIMKVRTDSRVVALFFFFIVFLLNLVFLIFLVYGVDTMLYRYLTASVLHTVQLDVVTLFACLLFVVVLLLGTMNERLRKVLSLHRDIRQMHKSINVHTMKQKGVSIKGSLFQFNNGIKTKQGIVSVLEMERAIENWTKELRKDTYLNKAVQFIIVFDELDKLSVHQNGESLKDIVGLFSRMKSFLNNTYAKFIFISGVEMHQQYLDAYSDRKNMLISIIDREEQINSFLTQEDEIRKVNKEAACGTIHPFRAIERYVCGNLMGGNGDQYVTLSKFVDQFKKVPKKGDQNNKEISKEEQEAKQHEKDCLERDLRQVKHALYHFINYLFFVTNGNPKKLMLHFEKQLEFIEPINDKNNERVIELKISGNPESTEKQWFFCLSYNDQLKNSFINYLSAPINYAILKGKQHFSDRLLVSASFLLNYIYKYHKNSFSLRNKEQFPEIFQSANSSDIRDLVGQMIHFLSKNHIQAIPSSVFRYKLPIKITEEIKNITKLSEGTSAIFNFTNFELYSIKHYYNTKIKDIKKGIRKGDADLEQSLILSSYYHIIGDLNLFSDDINDAIGSYKSSELLLREYLDGKSGDRYTQLTELIRVQLKLGLTYEKRETYSTAQNIYSALADRISETLFIDLKDLGLELENVRHKKNAHQYVYDDSGNIKKRIKRVATKKDGSEADHQESVLGSDYDDSGDNAKSLKMGSDNENIELTDYLLGGDYKKNLSILTKLNFSENIRMITQPLLVRLFIREKMHNSEIKISHIDQTVNDFTKIFFLYEMKERFLIPADFYSRLANIMFYKNTLTDRLVNNWENMLYFYDLHTAKQPKTYGNFESESRDYNIPLNRKEKQKIRADLTKYFEGSRSVDGSVSSNQRNPKGRKENRQKGSWSNIIAGVEACLNKREIGMNSSKCAYSISPSCFACKYYSRSLRFMLTNFTYIDYEEIKNTTKTRLIFDYLQQDRFKLRSANYLRAMATTLSNLGDTLLACCPYDEKNKLFQKNHEFLRCFNTLLGNKKRGYKLFCTENKKTQINNFSKIILYYYLAGRFYIKAGKHAEYAFQLKKILTLFAEIKTMSWSNQTEENRGNWIENKIINEICIRILKKLMKSIKYMYGHSSLQEEALLNMLMYGGQDKYASKIYSSVYADIEDGVYFTKEALIDYEKLDSDSFFKQYYNPKEQPLTTIYNRMLNLRLKALKNKYDIGIRVTKKGIDECEIEKIIRGKGNIDKVIESIFCLIKFSEFIGMQNDSKLFTNSIIAQVYFDLATWINIYLQLKGKVKNYDEKERDLGKLITSKKFSDYDVRYYYNKAINSFYKAIEVNSQGQAYQKMIEQMYLANDDLNDDVFHFFIALERFRINSGTIDYIVSIGKAMREEVTDEEIIKEEVKSSVTNQGQPNRRPENNKGRKNNKKKSNRKS
ncbi:ATP-binding protein [Puteibacter caeruleilacunae]|nr:ATP-binding protein [Puteibacter caeruleilacunae]